MQRRIGSFQLFRANGFFVLLAFLAFYFLMSFLQGEFGLFRYLQINAQIRSAERELALLESEREELQNLTHRLSDDYLDLDLLDEQARKRLGLVHRNEIIIR